MSNKGRDLDSRVRKHFKKDILFNKVSESRINSIISNVHLVDRDRSSDKNDILNNMSLSDEDRGRIARKEWTLRECKEFSYKEAKDTLKNILNDGVE